MILAATFSASFAIGLDISVGVGCDKYAVKMWGF
jgi:hypothetical protein